MMVYLGFFSPMIIIMAISVVLAKKGINPWILFWIGAGVEILALIGASRNPFMRSGPLWIIFFVILVVMALFVISAARSNEPWESEDNGEGTGYSQSSSSSLGAAVPQISQMLVKEWTCRQCGRINPEQHFICKCGRKKSENTEDETTTRMLEEMCSAKLTDDNDTVYGYLTETPQCTQCDFFQLQKFASVMVSKIEKGTVFIYDQEHSWESKFSRTGDGVFGDVRQVTGQNGGTFRMEILYKSEGVFQIGETIVAYKKDQNIAFYQNGTLVAKASSGTSNEVDQEKGVLGIIMHFLVTVNEQDRLIMMAFPFMKF